MEIPLRVTGLDWSEREELAVEPEDFQSYLHYSAESED
jgi:hypothetical protein